MSAVTEKAGRVPARARRSGLIDTLRGLSILLVIARHIDIRIPFAKTPWAAYLPDGILSLFVSGGGFGVRIFFVVSGFLITSTSLARWGSLEQIRVRDFYRFRFARIAPLLLALLVVASVLHSLRVAGYVIDPSRATLGEAWFAAIGLHVNWLEAQRGYLPASWDVLWTLSIEELFYLVFPLLGVGLGRMSGNRRRAVGTFLIVAVLLAMIALGPWARTHPLANDYWQSKSYLSCMDGIALGCLAALVAQSARLSDRMRRGLAWVGGFGIGAILFFEFRLPHGLTATTLALSVAVLLVARPRWEGFAWLRFLGRSSYEIYLTHMFVVLTGVQAYKGWQISPLWSPAWYAGLFLLCGILGDRVRTRFSEPANAWLRAR